ncbi:MAG TPA: phosphatidate cytidylyltransferase, partial [bacterium]|nr:phosphatidate cytidylyltransferase [bacterium]
AAVKDAGVIFPGHGGVLDRFDGVFAAAPVAYLLLHWWAS